MSRNMRFVIPAILAMLVLAGCSNRSGEGGSSPAPPQPHRKSGSVAPEDVSVEIIDEAGFADVLKRHRGKVVLIDYWATYCAPCLKLFPHTVELHRKLAHEGLVVISISLDYPEDEPDVRKRLAEQGAAFENFISRYGTGTRSADVFDLPSGVPYFQLYDRDGKLSKTFAAPIDPDEIDKAVEKFLALSRNG